MMQNNVWGRTPKNVNFISGNRRFKPNWRNFQMTITSKVLTRLTWNLKSRFRSSSRLRGLSSLPNNNPRWRTAAILNFWRNLNNSATIECICTKFDTEIQNWVPEAAFPSKFTSDEIQDGGGCGIEIYISGSHSADISFARNFARASKWRPKKQISNKLYFVQIQDGDCRHFEIHYNGLNSVSVALISGKFD